MVTFLEKWLAAVERKNSIACAGFDPPDFEMGRGDKGLPEGVNKRDWGLKYVEAVSPYVAALKPNMRYQGKPGRLAKQEMGDLEALGEIVGLAHSKGLVVIQDSKEVDIGETNDSGIYYAAKRNFDIADELRDADAVTFSPFAGNLEEAVKQARSRKIGLISMCLMSNPGYEREKNKLVLINPNDESPYSHKDHVVIREGNFSGTYVRQYIQLAHDARKFGSDAIVVGAPSKGNHVTEEEIEAISRYFGREDLLLVPGVGAQGGEEGMLAKYFDPDHLIINVGRAMMFPKGAKSTPEEQADAAKLYQERFNKLRAKAA